MPVQARYHFEPEAHEAQLSAVLHAVAAHPAPVAKALDRILRRHPKVGGAVFSKHELIRGARHFAPKFGLDAESLVEKLRMKPMRTQSGVAPVTVLSKPFACPGTCIFCPNDVRMPKSYLSMEPGAQRAAQHRFDPYTQTLSRLMAFFGNGHPIDKVELIVLGGTWSFYPEAYQIWFIKRCFDAMNDFEGVQRELPTPDARLLDHRDNPEQLLGSELSQTYNHVVRSFQQAHADPEGWDSASWQQLEAAHLKNEGALARCVGLSLETRPDHVNPAEVHRLRRLGATKIQIGVQSLCDEVLTLNKRGHDVATTRRAFGLLRGAGFKIHAHWMPNLYGSSPDKDLEDYHRLFDEPHYRPDELKIYPCALIESAELMQPYLQGLWRPYTEAELVELLLGCMASTPAWCRLTRVIRDIPSHDIVVGNTESNFRERIEDTARRRGVELQDIRAREIRRDPVDPEALRLDVQTYETSTSTESFLQMVTPEQRIVGYLRLSLPHQPGDGELQGAALIREVHVYGVLTEIGAQKTGRAQHLGLGRALVEHATKLAEAAGAQKLSVISGIGTRPYYRKLGFEDGALYQHLPLSR